MHFEELWEESEKLSKDNDVESFKKIGELVTEYFLLDNVPQEDYKKILKTKKIGEMLFAIASRCNKDGLNSYEALMIENLMRKSGV